MPEVQDKLIFERLIKAPRERVWRAWTTPEEVKKWWGPAGFTAPVIEIDLRPGGKYKYCMHGAPAPGMEEQDIWSAGEFKEITPMERIVVTDHFADADGNMLRAADFGLGEDFPDVMEIVVTFEDEGEGLTRLKVTYPLPGSEAAREAMLKTGMEEGWNSSLAKLAESVE
jgi:uncharacterized protein YndB with AHSA1/START domain